MRGAVPSRHPMIELPHNLIAKLDELAEQYDACQAELLTPELTADHVRVREVSIRRAALERVVAPYKSLTQTQRAYAETAPLLKIETDNDVRSMIRDELESLARQADRIAVELQARLAPAEDEALLSCIAWLRGWASEQAPPLHVVPGGAAIKIQSLDTDTTRAWHELGAGDAPPLGFSDLPATTIAAAAAAHDEAIERMRKALQRAQ